MTQVKELWKLKLMHDYFVSGKCGCGDMILSPQSGALLNRRQCRMLQVGIGEWELLSFNEGNFDDSDTLEMDFVSNERDFLYKTQWNWKANGTCPQIEIGIDNDTKINMTAPPSKIVNCGRNVFFKLTVPLQKANNEGMVTTELDFVAKEVYWEYWFVPRDGNINRQLELRVTSPESYCFTLYRSAGNPLNLRTIVFRSSVPLKLSEQGKDTISLYEILPSVGRKLLIRILEPPVPGQVPFNTEDTAVAVIYI